VILVSVPFFETPWLVRRAVDLLLGQTFPDLRIVVTKDGGRISPWPYLSDISDPRLIRFELPENRGRYYADSVALLANPFELFSVHDSDDWSDSTRFEGLINALNEADGVTDGFIRHGTNEQIEKHKPQPGLVGHRSGRSLWHIAHHKGLWRTEKLRPLGMGPTFRVGWDTYLMHFAERLLKIEWVNSYGYHQQRRKGSLTQSAGTGIASKYRKGVIEELDRLWGTAEQSGFDPGEVEDLLRPNPKLLSELSADAARLRELL
jgi:hypothetical protein